jgi:AraC-like DNA-binding protein
MLLHPTCETIDIPADRAARVQHVCHPAGTPPVARFLHFHDAVEIVLFDDAHGAFICDGHQLPVQPQTIMYVPTMRYHDYGAHPGPARWSLIQIDPYVAQKIALRLALPVPGAARMLRPGPAIYQRLSMLAHWLGSALADPDDAVAEHIIALILTVLWKLPGETGQPMVALTTDVERFTPVIERLHATPGQPFPLHDAAMLCRLSPAYFSRRFTQVFGCGFADYVASYRLHLAARQVTTTHIPLSTIGYNLGFSSPSHFAARYKQRFGQTPRAARGQM